MIFDSFEWSISKSVAQFFAHIFAYIMRSTKIIKDDFFGILRAFAFTHGGCISGSKVPKIRINSAFYWILNPLNQLEPPYEPPYYNRVTVSRVSLQGITDTRVDTNVSVRVSVFYW